MADIAFQRGQRVWWNDPDEGIASDYYTITSDVQKDIKELQANSGDDRSILGDLIIRLLHEGGGETQAQLCELESIYEGTDEALFSRENILRQDMRASILKHLRCNNGRITLQLPQTENDWINFDFPVTSTLYGRHDNDSVDITDIYINKDSSVIYADGQVSGEMRREYQIYPEHYSDVLWFIQAVLVK